MHVRCAQCEANMLFFHKIQQVLPYCVFHYNCTYVYTGTLLFFSQCLQAFLGFSGWWQQKLFTSNFWGKYCACWKRRKHSEVFVFFCTGFFSRFPPIKLHFSTPNDRIKGYAIKIWPAGAGILPLVFLHSYQQRDCRKLICQPEKKR